uniref:Uncharacterized protein n=1 Tax=Solanum tuberosum TaxID=4113 RepID=M1DBE9_SOLTU
MSNISSPSKLPVSQEIETLSSFNFSIPPSEESPSTPVCGVGESAESIIPHTEVVASPVLNSGKIFHRSHTLVLSGEKSQNSEAQSVVMPILETPTEDLEVVSRVA